VIPGKSIILAPPDSLMRAMVEEIDRERILRPIAEFRIGAHEVIDRARRNFQKTCGHSLGFDGPIFSSLREKILSLSKPSAHIENFVSIVSFAAVITRYDIPFSLEQGH